MTGAALIARQLEVALKKAGAPVDVFVLIDGSSSVSNPQFEIMKLSTRQLVDMFPSAAKDGEVPLRFGIIQFTSTLKIECGLSSNKIDINCSITAMKQVGGGTSALSAFKQAKLMFDTYRRAANRVIIFMTDGDCQDAIPEASKYRDTENIHIIAIGVGNGIPPATLGQIASNNSYFHFKTFDELREVFTHLDRTPDSPPSFELIARGSSNATLQLVLPPEVTKFNEWEVLKFDDKQNGFVPLGKSQVEKMCLHKLTPNTKYTLRARVKLPNNTYSADSTDFDFRTLLETHLSPIMRDPKKREAEFAKNIADIRNWTIPKRFKKLGVDRLNILFVGRMGAGKSSLLDSIASSLQGKFTALAPFRDSMETVTQTFKMYPMTRDEEDEPVICCFDVYGWSETNYKNAELGFMLEGHVKSGYTEAAGGFQAKGKDYRKSPKFNDKIHAVVVLVSSVTVGTTTEMSKLQEFYKFLTDREIQPIFVMTKVDRLDDEILIGHPENLFDSGVVDADALLKAMQNGETFYENRRDAIEAESKKSKKKQSSKKAKKDSESEEEAEEASDDEEEDESEEEDVKKCRKGKKAPSKEERVSPSKTDKKGVRESQEIKQKKVDPKKATTDAPVTPTKTRKGTDASPTKAPATPPPASPTITTEANAIMDLVQAALYLDVTEDEMEDLLHEQQIKGKKIGSKWRIAKEAIDRYLAD